MKRNILILGAGKSSIALIDYLVASSSEQNWEITVADLTAELAVQKTKSRPNTNAIGFDLYNEVERRLLIQKATIVISMLPAALHLIVAKDCLLYAKNLITPSYISDEMKQMSADVERAGLLFMNEMGLDPGIDHMSSMKLVDGIKSRGGKIVSYESHCGGLVAPESDDNPWHYKFTWNPRNVILAGKGAGGVKYREKGEEKILNYEQLYASAKQIHVEGYGDFESYPNRDSLKYISEYGLNDVETMYRGTLRVPPFCMGWNLIVRCGLTREDEIDTKTLQQEVNAVMSSNELVQNQELVNLLSSIGLISELEACAKTSDKIIPAVFLQNLLEKKWQMKETDKDMVVMVHQIGFIEETTTKLLQSSLVLKGTDSEHTAMAATVGLPVAIAAKMLLNEELLRIGVLMPKYPNIYLPILTELEEYGIIFNEKIIG
jgi:saccharopine dehydrogenase-like NADP-dependent oxidoreductase